MNKEEPMELSAEEGLRIRTELARKICDFSFRCNPDGPQIGMPDRSDYDAMNRSINCVTDNIKERYNVACK